LDNTPLQNWYQCGINVIRAFINSLTQNFYENTKNFDTLSEKAISSPGVFTGQFTANPIQDTCLNTTGWGKGQLFVNGYNIGRYWPTAGPQVRGFLLKNWGFR